MSALLPLHDRVIIRKAEKATQSEAGLALVHRRGDLPSQGVVVAVGPGRVVEDGTARIPVCVAPGDEVIFRDGAGHPIRFQGEDLLAMPEGELYAVVTP